MVEVFKTDVENPGQAQILIDQIHQQFKNYQANFDLEDCDRILRVKCNNGPIQATPLIIFLQDLGFSAEVLPD